MAKIQKIQDRKLEPEKEEVVIESTLEDAVKEIILQLEKEKARTENLKKSEPIEKVLPVEEKKEEPREKLDDFDFEDDDFFDDDFDDSYDFEPEEDEEVPVDEPYESTLEVSSEAEDEVQEAQPEVSQTSEETPIEDSVLVSEDSNFEQEESLESVQEEVKEEVESLEEEKIEIISSYETQDVEVITQSVEAKEDSNIFENENLENESYDPEFEPQEEVIEISSTFVSDASVVESLPNVVEEDKPLLPTVISEPSIFDKLYEQETEKMLTNQIEDKQMPDTSPYYQSRKFKSKRKVYLSILGVVLFLGFAVSVFFIVKAFM